jgi:hypothetical protein
MKMAVVWHFASCSLVEIDRRFRDAYCRHQIITLTLGAVTTSGTLISLHQTTLRNIPHDGHLHTLF